MKEIAIQNILEKMKDTADPVNGAVFEKTVETTLEDFCLFMLWNFDHVTMEVQTEFGNTLYLFYNGDSATSHIGTYIPFRKSGCFGGIRIGSNNPALADYAWNIGIGNVKNPFKAKGAVSE